jgi:cobalt-zinc-cadmium efflux system membrane fusion protein
MTGRTWKAWAAALLLLSAAAGCGRGGRDAAPGEGAGHDTAGEHAGKAHSEVRTGPHGGRLFEAEGLRLELLLAGEGGPPTFSAYLFDASGRPLRPTDERLGLALERLGGRRDSIAFRIDGDHLHSTTSIAEPHSFAVAVTLRHGGRVERWGYEQVESRVELSPEAIRASGIEVGRAGPASIQVTIEAPGEVRLNSERVVHIRPRFAGQVEQLRKRLGDSVRRGEVLAVVHSNESLADYEITAPMDGTVVGQESAAGQAVDASSVIFTLADLSSVWVDFPIYPQTAGRVRIGQPVAVRSESGPALSGAGTVRYVGPLLEQDTRVSYGRVVLDNRDRRWQPGLYVTCAVTVERVAVPVAVPEEAIVRMREGPAVFRAAGNLFEPQAVLPGRSDGRMTEIVAGLEPGAAIVVTKAFLLKAELGKGEAGHEH